METAQELEILGSLVLIVAAVATLLVVAPLHPGSALAPIALALLGLGFVGLRHALRTRP
ncbi:MAG TPA: hypothetical protein VFM49_28690 [Chloroflexia bacterium]|jgi:hypothetical protein|nr:hypothetical protein [Chloroflexia bacterium]